MTKPEITPEELEDRQTFENVYDFELDRQDQHVIAHEIVTLILRLGLSLEDAFYLLGKIGVYMALKDRRK